MNGYVANGGLGPMLGQVHHFTHSNPGKAPTPKAGIKTRQRVFMACLTRDYPTAIISAIIIRLPTWPRGHGYHDMNGKRLTLLILPIYATGIAVLDRDAVQRGYRIPKHMGDIPPG